MATTISSSMMVTPCCTRSRGFMAADYRKPGRQSSGFRQAVDSARQAVPLPPEAATRIGAMHLPASTVPASASRRKAVLAAALAWLGSDDESSRRRRGPAGDDWIVVANFGDAAVDLPDAVVVAISSCRTLDGATVRSVPALTAVVARTA